MTDKKIALTLMTLLVSAAACAPRAPIAQAPCPCPAGQGYICCANKCELAATSLCGGASGTSGTTGTGGDGTAGMMGTAGVSGTSGAAGAPTPDGGVDAPVVVSPFVAVGIGAAHACGVRADGTISCRGANDKGQASPPPGLYLDVVAGAEHTCGSIQDLNDRKKNGAWVCWGDDTYGQLPPSIPPESMVAAGARHTCIATYAQGITCWGDNSLGQTSVPPIAATETVDILVAGRNHTCAWVVTNPTDGGAGAQRMVCWGDDSRGQLTPPADLPHDVFWLSAGGDHTCSSGFMDNSLRCWGDNDQGQSTEPVGNLRGVSVASGHSCAMPFSTSMRIQCWGSGWGSATSMPPAGTGWNAIFAGDYINCALPNDTTKPLLCWGETYEPWY